MFTNLLGKSLLTWADLLKQKNEAKEAYIALFERADISYCKPGRADKVFFGKNLDGKKIYKSKLPSLDT